MNDELFLIRGTFSSGKPSENQAVSIRLGGWDAWRICFFFVGLVTTCALPWAKAQSLNETFDDGVANNWTIVSGTEAWAIPAGTDRVYTNSGFATTAFQISTYTGATWTSNFVLQARLKLWGSGTSNRVGLVYNYQATSPSKYYAILLHKAASGQQLQFIEKTSSDTNPLPVQSHTYPLPTSGAPDNNWVDLRIERVGNTTTVIVSSSTDSATFTRVQTAIVGAGRVGVIDRSADSAFNSVSVEALPPFTPGITQPAGPTYDPTRYVDIDAGAESNPGTRDLPWKYAPGMPASTHAAAPGDVIALRRGGVWRLTSPWVIPSSDTSGNPIVYTAYGSGPLPKVTVLEDISTGWTLQSGSVYQRPVSGTVERLYINNVGMGEALSSTVGAAKNWVGQASRVIAELEPIPNPNGIVVGQEYPTGIVKYWKQVGTTLYLYSPNGNPNTLGAVEALKDDRDYAIRVSNKSYVYIDRIAAYGGSVAVVNFEASGTNAPTDVRFTSGEVRSAKSKGIRVWGGTTATAGFNNGQIKWNTVDAGNGPTTRVTPDDAQYGRNPDSDTEDTTLESYPGEGKLGSHDGISLWNGVQGWVVAQNEVSNFWHTQLKVCVINTTYSAAVGNTLEHNEAHAEAINYAHGLEINCNPEPSFAALLQGNVARFNHIHDTWVNNKHEGNNTEFYGNLIVGVFGTPRYPLGSNSWSSDGVDINGYGGSSGGIFAFNTIVNAGGAGLALVGTPSNGPIPSGLVIANNIISHCGNKRNFPSTPYYIAFRDQDEGTSNVEVDNNVMYSPNTTRVYEHNGRSTRDTVATMDSLESSWDNNIGSNPLFEDYAGDDFRLTTLSPAQGAAKNITSILPESAGWNDIGCWQTP